MPIIVGVGASGTVSSASGGKVYAINTIGSVAGQTVAGTNPARKKITFHNPGTVDLLVFPQFEQSTGTNVALNVTTASRGGSFLVFANGGTLSIEGECQGLWKAVAVSGANNSITVMDSNV